MALEINSVEQLRNWFRECPAISDRNRFRVDFLAESPTEYAIYAVPSTINYRENVLGEEVPDDEQSAKCPEIQRGKNQIYHPDADSLPYRSWKRRGEIPNPNQD